MKNLKKILCLVLCLAVVLTMAFTFVACDRELTEEEKEKLRTELIADSEPDLTRAETTLETTDTANGTKSQVSITWDMSAANAKAATTAAPTINADIISVQYSLLDATIPATVNVAFIRGDMVYGKSASLELKGSDKLAAAKAKMSELTNNLEKITMEDLLKQLSTETGADLSALGNLDLSGTSAAMDTKQLAAFLQKYFTILTVTDDGFSISFNFNKVVDELWDIVYSVAEIIDNSRDVTLYKLYENASVKSTINQLPLTAAEMEDAINQGIAEYNKQNPSQQVNWTALTVRQNETLYDYLGRYFDIEVDIDKYVGDMTVGELLCLLAKTETAPDLTDALDDAKLEYVAMLKQMFAQFTIDLNFTKDKKFDGVTIGMAGTLNINVKILQSVTLAEVAA